jgi:hypothetical protein
MLTVVVTDAMTVGYFAFTGVMLVAALLARGNARATRPGRSLPDAGASDAFAPAPRAERAWEHQARRWPTGRVLLGSCSPDYAALFAEAIQKVRQPDAPRSPPPSQRPGTEITAR